MLVLKQMNDWPINGFVVASGPAHLVLLVPWLLFLGMGLTTARLVYQAWQEQALLEALEAERRHEKILLHQKRNFVSLSSHYLRTPLTVIANGVELLASSGAGKSKAEGLKSSVEKLRLAVNALLETQNNTAAHQKLPIGDMKKANNYLILSLAGAFIVISTAVYLLNNTDFQNFSLSSLLGEAAVLLMTVVLTIGAARGRRARRELRQQADALLKQQRELDRERNGLVKEVLQSLTTPLEELKSGVNSLPPTPMAKPVEEGIGSMEKTVRQFTILTALQAGSIGKISQDVSLKQVVAAIAERYRPELQTKRLSVRTDLKADRLRQDGLLLEFVLNSLIDNAIEYSPEGKHIDVISRPAKVDINIFVRDEGSGLSSEKLAILFQPFSRAEDVVKSFDHEGMGMSLYLDRLIMHYLGGEIAAESQEGKGTTIKIRLAPAR